MLRVSHSLADRYLDRLRRADEEKALRRVGASPADLRVWRRDPVFRESERAALAAPASPARVINPITVPGLVDDEQFMAGAREYAAEIARRIGGR
jgi:hypothetical protein